MCGYFIYIGLRFIYTNVLLSICLSVQKLHKHTHTDKLVMLLMLDIIFDEFPQINNTIFTITPNYVHIDSALKVALLTHALHVDVFARPYNKKTL